MDWTHKRIFSLMLRPEKTCVCDLDEILWSDPNRGQEPHIHRNVHNCVFLYIHSRVLFVLFLLQLVP